jgi:hypothetical protein
MVALTITAIVATISYSGLSVGLDSWERGNRAIDQLDRQAIVERALKRQLSIASPGVFEIQDQEAALFSGSADRLEFISDYSLIDGHADFRRIGQVYIQRGIAFRGRCDHRDSGNFSERVLQIPPSRCREYAELGRTLGLRHGASCRCYVSK